MYFYRDYVNEKETKHYYDDTDGPLTRLNRVLHRAPKAYMQVA
jgi:hypothetical protein